MTLAETTRLATSRGQATHLPVFLVGLAYPLDVRITSDGLVEGIDHDDLVELVGGVLGYPVAVHHTQGLAATSGTLL